MLIAPPAPLTAAAPEASDSAPRPPLLRAAASPVHIDTSPLAAVVLSAELMVVDPPAPLLICTAPAA
jgi:hypothetical protein